MDAGRRAVLHDELVERRDKLRSAVAEAGEAEDLARLLRQVDAALERMHSGDYGRCEICHEEIDDEDLLGNPLIRYCLCKLTPEQQQALQDDLDLASRIQSALLPRQDVRAAGWEVHYRYRPAGPVSGDYCDVVTRRGNGSDVFFVVGDVSGKGIAASLVMAHLNASFRTLIDLDLPLRDLLDRTHRLLVESTIPSRYATLVCGRARATGEIEISNAGHGPALSLRKGVARRLEATSLPLGMFPESRHRVATERYERGDTLFLCTDGITEARDRGGREYGIERLACVLERCSAYSPRDLADECLADLDAFLAGTAPSDDATLMVLRRLE
jgi:sigma-B regulation protein RsbU (phosphoserine phosphatase)